MNLRIHEVMSSGQHKPADIDVSRTPTRVKQHLSFLQEDSHTPLWQVLVSYISFFL